MRTVSRTAVAAVVTALWIGSFPAFAGNCSWQTTPSISFTYSVFGSGATATGAFSFRCSANAQAKITITRSSVNNSFFPRQMALSTNNAERADYNLYLSPGGAIWGDQTGGTSYDIYAAGNKLISDTVYGAMPAGLDLVPTTTNNYADTVYAVLSWVDQNTGNTGSVPQITIPVTATVTSECRVDAFNINFGVYDPFAATAANASTLLKVYCTRTAGVTSVVLDNGAHALGGQRRMMSTAGGFLNYGATMGSIGGSSIKSSLPINGGFTISGTVPPSQDVAVGDYADVLVATVNY